MPLVCIPGTITDRPRYDLLRKKLHAVNTFGEVEGIFAEYLASDAFRTAEAA